MRRAGLAALGAACVGSGSRPDELTVWRLASVDARSVGCEAAAALVDDLTGGYPVDGGLAYRTNAAATRAQRQRCDLRDVAGDAVVDFDTCEGLGIGGLVEDEVVTFAYVLDLGDDACPWSLAVVEQVVDDGLEGTLHAELRSAAAAGCPFEVDGAPVAPDGCLVAIDAELRLVGFRQER